MGDEMTEPLSPEQVLIAIGRTSVENGIEWTLNDAIMSLLEALGTDPSWASNGRVVRLRHAQERWNYKKAAQK